MTKDSSAKRKAGKRKPEKLSFTQDFIPIKNLEHGIIETRMCLACMYQMK